MDADAPAPETPATEAATETPATETPATETPATETRDQRLKGILVRLTMAHIAAYLPMFIYAVALMPLVIILHIKALEKLETEAEIGDYVVHRLLWPAIGAGVVPHLLAIPFIFGKTKNAGHKLFLGGLVVFSGIGVVGGAIGWALFLTH